MIEKQQLNDVLVRPPADHEIYASPASEPLDAPKRMISYLFIAFLFGFCSGFALAVFFAHNAQLG